MLPPATRDLARRLIAYETVVGESSELTEPAFFRVYEKLRRHLGALAGIIGFQSLASRAVTLARAEAPGLSAIQIRRTDTGSGAVNLTRNMMTARLARKKSCSSPSYLDCSSLSLANL